ncbi:hypothetical protein SADUNF_Sadunf05G0199300 [Salix dunnii]|uniref:Uncharacterized protein n=1 Tax=Salix dunnii TaxID=1413687 RepID=A0A835K9P6_9ROSI|nr:hypothetical protein SADUNF_Sadunf05G0199300 [Salix dunnii]
MMKQAKAIITKKSSNKLHFLVLSAVHKHQIFTFIFRSSHNILLAKGLGTLFSAYLCTLLRDNIKIEGLRSEDSPEGQDLFRMINYETSNVGCSSLGIKSINPKHLCKKRCLNADISLLLSSGLSLAMSMVGRPLASDEPTIKSSQVDYTRICIELEVDTPPVHQFQVASSLTKNPIMIEVIYEWKPARCHSRTDYQETLWGGP